jgi:hypothetical protein
MRGMSTKNVSSVSLTTSQPSEIGMSRERGILDFSQAYRPPWNFTGIVKLRGLSPRANYAKNRVNISKENMIERLCCIRELGFSAFCL